MVARGVIAGGKGPGYHGASKKKKKFRPPYRSNLAQIDLSFLGAPNFAARAH